MADYNFSHCERGEGRLGFLLTILMLAFIGYFLFHSAPHYIHKVQMQDAVTEIVRFAATQNLSESDVRARLTTKAAELSIPRNAHIEVKRTGKLVTARVSYSQDITLPFYTYTWPVSLEARDSGF